MPKYTVEYRIPYDHVVEIGIEADSPEAAKTKGEELFDEGTFWDDTPEMPLLYDDYVEQAGDMEWEVTEVEEYTERDYSVKKAKQEWAAQQFMEMIARIDPLAEDATEALQALIRKAREIDQITKI